MLKGKITHYNGDRGFGFVRPDDGQADLFVHIRECDGVEELVVGQTVEYEEEVSRRTGKPEAVRVRVIEPAG
jgi:CspA family cold shock protein